MVLVGDSTKKDAQTEKIETEKMMEEGTVGGNWPVFEFEFEYKGCYTERTLDSDIIGVQMS